MRVGGVESGMKVACLINYVILRKLDFGGKIEGGKTQQENTLHIAKRHLISSSKVNPFNLTAVLL